MIDIATAASDQYLRRWAVLRDEGWKLSQEAANVRDPEVRRKLRNQAALCDQYAVICHHAAWRELHPDEPER